MGVKSKHNFDRQQIQCAGKLSLTAGAGSRQETGEGESVWVLIILYGLCMAVGMMGRWLGVKRKHNLTDKHIVLENECRIVFCHRCR